MSAINLRQTIQFFNPAEPLRGQSLHNWFVPRPETPRQFLRVLLESERDPLKLLFVGHRGSGKSTELNKLAEELADSFVTIPFNVLEVTGRTSPTYEDLMLTLSLNVTAYCIEKGWVGRPLSEPLRAGWQQVADWWQQVVAGAVRPAAAETSTYATLGTLLGEIEVGARQSSQTSELIRNQVNRQMPELIRHFNWVLAEVHKTLNPKRLLLMIEGLDKVDLQAARDIFCDHAPTITAPKVAMIYTFPLALRHSDDYETVRRSFNDDCYLHNWSIRHANGTPHEEGYNSLRKLVLTRMKAELIAEEALRLAIESCGGVPVQLVKLIRSAAVYALVRDSAATTILLSDLQDALKDLRRELSAPLRNEDWPLLLACHGHRQFSGGDPNVQRLLYNGSLIEYSNDHPWCDVHPVLWSLVEANTGRAP